MCQKSIWKSKTEKKCKMKMISVFSGPVFTLRSFCSDLRTTHNDQISSQSLHNLTSEYKVSLNALVAHNMRCSDLPLETDAAAGGGGTVWAQGGSGWG